MVLSQACARIKRDVDRGPTRYPFPLLCDEDRAVIKGYGVWHRAGLDAFNMARPASFLIEAPTRRIVYSFVGSKQFERATLGAILQAWASRGTA